MGIGTIVDFFLGSVIVLFLIYSSGKIVPKNFIIKFLFLSFLVLLVPYELNKIFLNINNQLNMQLYTNLKVFDYILIWGLNIFFVIYKGKNETKIYLYYFIINLMVNIPITNNVMLLMLSFCYILLIFVTSTVGSALNEEKNKNEKYIKKFLDAMIKSYLILFIIILINDKITFSMLYLYVFLVILIYILDYLNLFGKKTSYLFSIVVIILLIGYTYILDGTKLLYGSIIFNTIINLISSYSFSLVLKVWDKLYMLKYKCIKKYIKYKRP